MRVTPNGGQWGSGLEGGRPGGRRKDLVCDGERCREGWEQRPHRDRESGGGRCRRDRKASLVEEVSLARDDGWWLSLGGGRGWGKVLTPQTPEEAAGGARRWGCRLAGVSTAERR